MSKYYKGIETKTKRRIFAEVYDEPQPSLIDALHDNAYYNIAEYSYMDNTGRHWIGEGIEIYDDHILKHLREITKEEYMVYYDCQHLIEEFWLNGRTGGCPSNQVDRVVMDLQRNIKRFMKDDSNNKDAEVMANAFSKLIKACEDEAIDNRVSFLTNNEERREEAT